MIVQNDHPYQDKNFPGQVPLRDKNETFLLRLLTEAGSLIYSCWLKPKGSQARGRKIIPVSSIFLESFVLSWAPRDPPQTQWHCRFASLPKCSTPGLAAVSQYSKQQSLLFPEQQSPGQVCWETHRPLPNTIWGWEACLIDHLIIAMCWEAQPKGLSYKTCWCQFQTDSAPITLLQMSKHMFGINMQYSDCKTKIQIKMLTQIG